jgi:hypothetical protein
MMHKYIDCLWTVVLTKCVMICFAWLTCVFGGLVIFIAFVLYIVILKCSACITVVDII